jgi:hypothetical protein
MTLFHNLLNNNLLTHDWLFLGLFSCTTSLLGYLIFILRLGSIMIYFNQIFYNLKQSIY